MTDLEGYLGHFQRAPMRAPRRRNLERLEQEALTSAASLKWWWPGYRHHMAERASRSEAWKGLAAGVKSGWPDVTLHIPERWWERHPTEELDRVEPTLAALELKVGGGRPTPAQLDCLTMLEACGYRTTVAWGWEEALAWLDKVAGPRPEVLPDGW